MCAYFYFIFWLTINVYLFSAQSGDMSSIFSDISQQFSTEVEDEANSYFQRIYNQPPHPTMSIDEVLDMLKRFKDSPNRREKVWKESLMWGQQFHQYKKTIITSQLTNHKKERWRLHNVIGCWKSRCWLGTGTKGGLVCSVI